MADPALVDRLAALPSLSGLPRNELEWLAAHGRLETHPAGTVIARKGARLETLWIILSGHAAVRVDRGAGPRRVIDWRTGDVSGLLPYSRMIAPPGDNYLEAPSELLTFRAEQFPEMIHRCPEFTAYTVHSMLDRARSFNASDLQDEKMISLGRLAAGLAHELNNPASATVRSAKLLLTALTNTDEASQALRAAGASHALLDAVEELAATALAPPDRARSPIEQADREDEIADWLARHDADGSLAAPLADTALDIEALDRLAEMSTGDSLEAALRWIAARSSASALAADIDRAATRVHELVAAVKQFTYMDKLAGPESVDVEAGLRDTLRIVAAKAKEKGVAISLAVQDQLPRAHATGGELNQVWLNLVDNALDAVAESGRIDISARHELDRIVVRIVDNGPGIPPDVLPHIFDPFFTTKPPGQGTGLGLDITRRLVRRYRGDVLVDTHPGRTEFKVSLAVEAASEA